MISVRRAAPNDAERVHSLMEKVENANSLPMQQYEQIYLDSLADDNLASLVVTVDSDVAAFGSVRFYTKLNIGKPAAAIQEFYVDDRCRGRGIAVRLINAMMLLARDRGCVMLEAESPRANKWSHRFFEKQGFVFTHYKLAMNIGLEACEDESQALIKQGQHG